METTLKGKAASKPSTKLGVREILAGKFRSWWNRYLTDANFAFWWTVKMMVIIVLIPIAIDGIQIYNRWNQELSNPRHIAEYFATLNQQGHVIGGRVVENKDDRLLVSTGIAWPHVYDLTELRHLVPDAKPRDMFSTWWRMGASNNCPTITKRLTSEGEMHLIVCTGR